MPDPNIVTRLLETPGFGWQCGEPLRDKGSYFRCSCGCSQPDADSDGYLTISQPKILREAADEIERLRKELDARIAMCDMRFEKIGELANERDEARREICENVAATAASVNAKQWAEERGWDCFEKDGNA